MAFNVDISGLRSTSAGWRWRLIDSTLCLLVFFPSMLFYWRGIWDLYGVYLFPDDELLCNWSTFALGCCSIFGYFVQPALNILFASCGDGHPAPGGKEIATRTGPFFVILSRLVMYVHGVTAMAYWRGVWTVTDFYLGTYLQVRTWLGAVVGLVVCYPALVALNASRTIIFPPFVVAHDTRPDLLVPSTRFHTQLNWRSGLSVFKYTLDCLFTQYVILTLTIVTWRSILTGYDVLLECDNPVKADVISVSIGIAACIVLFGVEGLFQKVSEKNRRNRRTLYMWNHVVYLLVFAGEAFLWRGAWNLNARYVIADARLGGWVNHALGTVLLLSLQVFSYVGSCGCSLDSAAADQDASTTAATVAGSGATSDGYYGGFFTTQYIRHYCINKHDIKMSPADEEKASPLGNENTVSISTPLSTSPSCDVTFA